MYRLQKYKKHLFNWCTRGVLRLPPLRCDPTSLVVVLSQCYHADLHMYLVAVRSFARFVRPRFFVIVDDGLTDAQRELLCHQLGDVRFVRTADVDVGRCPRRGTWERLATVIRTTQEHYVVQLDADTITLRMPDEVIECVRAGRGFVLGTRQGQRVVSASEASAFVKDAEVDHVQVAAEKALARLPDAAGLRYVRGCSGFAGYAKGAFRFEALEKFSVAMQECLGAESWSRWGSEQVASNFLIANSKDPFVLPIDRYKNWNPSVDTSDASFLHFLGATRFDGVEYLRRSRQVIAGLRYAVQ